MTTKDMREAHLVVTGMAKLLKVEPPSVDQLESMTNEAQNSFERILEEICSIYAGTDPRRRLLFKHLLTKQMEVHGTLAAKRVNEQVKRILK